jgi:hypothetical protein
MARVIGIPRSVALLIVLQTFVPLPLPKEALIRCFERGASGIMMFRHVKKENLGPRAFSYKGSFLVQNCITLFATHSGR